MDLQARAIMHLAAGPVHLSRENSVGSTVGFRSFPWHLQTANDKGGLPPCATISQAMQTGITWKKRIPSLWLDTLIIVYYRLAGLDTGKQLY